MVTRLATLLITALVFTLCVLNILIWQSPVLGILAGGLWLIGSALLAGSLWDRNRNITERFALGLLIVITLLILAGSASFYLSRVTDFHIALITLLLPSALMIIDWHKEESLLRTFLAPQIKSRKHFFNFSLTRTTQWIRTQWLPLVLIGAYVILYGSIIALIVPHRTSEAILGPWEVIPHWTLILYFLLTLLLLWIIQNTKRAPALLLSAHIFLASSLALLIYAVGYGFDPFVHRATETILSHTGTITPTPFLYVGQYTLVVFLSRLLMLPLATVDIWLLPILSGTLLPPLFIAALSHTFQTENKINATSLLALLVIPAYFIVTIPQPLANFLYLLIILLSLSYLARRIVPLSLLWGMGVAVFFIHPLTGIPALLYLTLLTLLARPVSRFRTRAAILFPFLGALAIPALIAAGNLLNRTASSAAPSSAPPFPALLPHYLPFLSLAHTAELWQRTLPLLFISACVAGTYLLWKHARGGLTLVPWLTAFSLALGYLLVRHVPLTAIIAYERAEFTERMLTLMGITLLPIAAFALTILCKQLFANFKKTFTSLAVCAALITIGWYYAYPRVDSFAKSRGFSVSQSDIATVRWIEEDAAAQPYIVLSNQSVAAAALQEFGFKQYFNATDCPRTTHTCKLFYYPIPTSSPLYQYYLDMVYSEPSRETVMSAMALAGVPRAYFVLNDYWLDAQKIAPGAAEGADKSVKIQRNEIFVYEY